MSSLLRWAHLMAVLWAAAQCAAAQQVPLSDPNAGPSGGNRELLAAVERSARSAAEAVIATLNSRMDSLKTELSSQLDSVQTDLEAQLDRIESRVVTRLVRLETELDSVSSQLTSQVRGIQTELTSQNTDLSARLQWTQTQMESRLDGETTALFSRLVDMQSQLLTAMLTPRDCSDLPAGATSGVYLLWPSPNRAVPAYCDQDTGGGNWTVIQRRADVRPRTDFNLGWEAYGRGFGALQAEFWWGNENLYRLTALQGRRYELRVDLETTDGQRRHALYQGFRVSHVSDGYRLTLADYSGDAGDSLTGSSGQRFSTRDKDQDGNESGNCADLWEGGWWYNDCPHSNPNGPYLSDQNSTTLYGVVWAAWETEASLKEVGMKIRPAGRPARWTLVDP